MNFRLIIIVATALSSAAAFQSNPTWNTAARSATAVYDSTDDVDIDRRSFLNSLFLGAAAITTAGILLPTSPANAGIDPSLLKSYSVEGDVSGTQQRLRQIEEIQRPASDNLNIPYEKLPSGVEYREYREGKGEAGGYTKMTSDESVFPVQFCFAKFLFLLFSRFILFPCSTQSSKTVPRWLPK